MSTLTPEQLAGYALRAGFKGSGAAWAVAVALAESGGNTAATHVNADKYHSIDRGPWQINSHWHPEVSAADAVNPTTAAAAAFRISKGGTDWHEWSTYSSGAASSELSRASLALARPVQPSSSATGGAVDAGFPNPLGMLGGGLGTLLFPGGSGSLIPNPLGAAGDAIDAAGTIAKSIATLAGFQLKLYLWVANPHHWARVLMAVGGGAIVVVGVIMLSESDISGPAPAIAGAAVEAGKGAAKGAGKAARRAKASRPAQAPAKAGKAASGAAKAGKAATVKAAAKTAAKVAAVAAV